MMKARRAGERSAGRGDRLGHDLSDRGRAQRHEGRDARVCRARRNAEGSVRVASATKALLTLWRPSRALPAVSDQSRQPPSMTARDTSGAAARSLSASLSSSPAAPQLLSTPPSSSRSLATVSSSRTAPSLWASGNGAIRKKPCRKTGKNPGAHCWKVSASPSSIMTVPALDRENQAWQATSSERFLTRAVTLPVRSANPRKRSSALDVNALGQGQVFDLG